MECLESTNDKDRGKTLHRLFRRRAVDVKGQAWQQTAEAGVLDTRLADGVFAERLREATPQAGTRCYAHVLLRDGPALLSRLAFLHQCAVTESAQHGSLNETASEAEAAGSAERSAAMTCCRGRGSS